MLKETEETTSEMFLKIVKSQFYSLEKGVLKLCQAATSKPTHRECSTGPKWKNRIYRLVSGPPDV